MQLCLTLQHGSAFYQAFVSTVSMELSLKPSAEKFLEIFTNLRDGRKL